MIKEHEIIEPITLIIKMVQGIDPIYKHNLERLLFRLQNGEPIIRGIDQIYETHGNGD